MKKIYVISGCIFLILACILIYANRSYIEDLLSPSTGPVACTMEAKLCPDGSYVGRTGPHCEFSACPEGTQPLPSTGNKSTLTVGQKATIAGVTITFNAVVQDSRCPVDVVCIQAGKVEVNITISDGLHTERKNMSLNETPYAFYGHHVAIVDVVPARKSQTEIQSSQYQITFHVTKDSDHGFVTGHVTISPTCPVERMPPDPQCAPKGYSTLVDISGPHNFFLELHTDTNGMFRTPLPPGPYTILVRQTSIYPRCDAKDVTIGIGATSTANIVCDSGIR